MSSPAGSFSVSSFNFLENIRSVKAFFDVAAQAQLDYKSADKWEIAKKEFFDSGSKINKDLHDLSNHIKNSSDKLTLDFLSVLLTEISNSTLFNSELSKSILEALFKNIDLYRGKENEGQNLGVSLIKYYESIAEYVSRFRISDDYTIKFLFENFYQDLDKNIESNENNIINFSYVLRYLGIIRIIKEDINNNKLNDEMEKIFDNFDKFINQYLRNKTAIIDSAETNVIQKNSRLTGNAKQYSPINCITQYCMLMKLIHRDNKFKYVSKYIEKRKGNISNFQKRVFESLQQFYENKTSIIAKGQRVDASGDISAPGFSVGTFNAATLLNVSGIFFNKVMKGGDQSSFVRLISEVFIYQYTVDILIIRGKQLLIIEADGDVYHHIVIDKCNNHLDGKSEAKRIYYKRLGFSYFNVNQNLFYNTDNQLSFLKNNISDYFLFPENTKFSEVSERNICQCKGKIKSLFLYKDNLLSSKASKEEVVEIKEAAEDLMLKSAASNVASIDLSQKAVGIATVTKDAASLSVKEAESKPTEHGVTGGAVFNINNNNVTNNIFVVASSNSSLNPKAKSFTPSVLPGPLAPPTAPTGIDANNAKPNRPVVPPMYGFPQTMMVMGAPVAAPVYVNHLGGVQPFFTPMYSSGYPMHMVYGFPQPAVVPMASSEYDTVPGWHYG